MGYREQAFRAMFREYVSPAWHVGTVLLKFREKVPLFSPLPKRILPHSFQGHAHAVLRGADQRVA
jgi:hypothetical protein